MPCVVEDCAACPETLPQYSRQTLPSSSRQSGLWVLASTCGLSYAFFVPELRICPEKCFTSAVTFSFLNSASSAKAERSAC